MADPYGSGRGHGGSNRVPFGLGHRPEPVHSPATHEAVKLIAFKIRRIVFDVINIKRLLFQS